MKTIQQTSIELADGAVQKFDLLKTPVKFAISAALAGAYIGIGDVLVLTAVGPLASAGSPFKAVFTGIVFAVALSLVVFGGAELFTGTVMSTVHGLLRKTIRIRDYIILALATFFGNIIGAAVFSGIITLSGIITHENPAGELLGAQLVLKIGETNTQLFFRAILCNLLVGLAVWCVARLESEGGKANIIFWTILAFAASGFEHVVANMTTFWLGVMNGYDVPLAAFANNMLIVGLGNVVGGALLVALPYYIIGKE